MERLEKLMNDVETADRVILIKNGIVRADIANVGINRWQVAEIGDTYFQEVSTKYVEGVLELWNAINAKSEYIDGIMTIFLK